MRYPDGTWSPASKAFDEAIELSLEDRSPYPHFAAFIDTEGPRREREIDEAFEEGYAAVLVSPDGTAQVLPAPLSAVPVQASGGRRPPRSPGR